MFSHVSQLTLCIYCCLSIDSFPPSLSLRNSLPSHSLPASHLVCCCTSFWHFVFFLLICLSLPSLLPFITVCWTGMNEPFWGTMPLQAWMHVCVCVFVSVCVCMYVFNCVCDTLWLWAQTPPGGKHGCSLLFLLLFQITFCFINAMVICFLLLLWSLCLSKWRKAQRTPIDLSGSRDPVPLSQFPPCQSFMNAAGGKWPLGNCNRQYVQNKGLET